MIEVYGDLWEFKAEARVITTNGTIKNNGDAVMGRGCAAELKSKLPGVAAELGMYLAQHGNHVYWLGMLEDTDLFSFPVKHEWNEQAQLSLIDRSTDELVTIITALHANIVVMPRPGCGNGGLEWEGQFGVKQVIMNKLDDRFHVIHYTRN